MVKLETDITYIKTKVDDNEAKLDKFIESADKKYASKLTENIVYGLCGTILGAVILALIYLVINSPK